MKGRPLLWPVLGLLLCSCVPLDQAQVRAERATFRAVVPDLRAYYQADQALDAEARARKLRTLKTWNTRLQENERALGIGGGT